MPQGTSGEALAILEQALCLEVDGEAFYRQAAAATADRSGQRMFAELADQEADHQRIIRRQIDSLRACNCWAADAGLQGVSCDLSQPLFPRGLARAKALGPRAHELEALWFALEKESESYELYRKAALQASDAMALDLYRYLMAAEREHFDVLMTTYEAIANQR